MKKLLLVPVLVAAVAGVASAQPRIDKIELVPPPAPTDPKAPKPAPGIMNLKVAVRSEVFGMKVADFSIRPVVEEADTPPEAIRAIKAEAFNESDSDCAVVVLVQGNERFMGNPNTVIEDGEVREPQPGAYDQVKSAIDILKTMGPKKTKGALLVYGAEIKEKMVMGPISDLAGEDLGLQAEYLGQGTKQFKNGLERAFAILTNEPGRKILVVIGDGGDTAADAKIKDVASKIIEGGVEVYAIRANPRIDSDPSNKANMKNLTTKGVLKEAAKMDEIPELAKQIVDAVAAQYLVLFPGEMLAKYFDGKEHTFIVIARKTESLESDPITLPAPPEAPPPPPPKKSKWWLWLLIPFLLIGGAVVFLVTRKKAPPPEEEEEEEEEPAPAPAAAPQKTMMFGAASFDTGVLQVGWIVPMTGAQQYQTFKLQPRSTIGTGPDCQVVVTDPFMSTHHAEIYVDQNGFHLIDRGSTNGVIVNARRVSSHDLLDNDVFTLGKTEFKFKSIN